MVSKLEDVVDLVLTILVKVNQIVDYDAIYVVVDLLKKLV